MPTARPPPKYERGSLVKLEWKSREGELLKTSVSVQTQTKEKTSKVDPGLSLKSLLMGAPEVGPKRHGQEVFRKATPLPQQSSNHNRDREQSPKLYFCGNPAPFFLHRAQGTKRFFSFARKTKGRARSAFFFFIKNKGRAKRFFFKKTGGAKRASFF